MRLLVQLSGRCRMDWLKDALVPIAQTGIWALLVKALGSEVLSRFDQAINRTLDRLKKAGPAEFEPVTTNQLDVKVDPPVVATQALPPFPVGSLPAVYEKNIREALHKLPQAEQETAVIRVLAATQIAWRFEAFNFLIWGSQIALLQALNVSSLSVEQAKPFYVHAATVFPDLYKTYSFESWLDWLISHPMFVSREGDVLSITDEGREFLKFLITRGYSFSRLG